MTQGGVAPEVRSRVVTKVVEANEEAERLAKALGEVREQEEAESRLEKDGIS